MWDLIVSVPDHCLSFYFRPYTVTTLLLSSTKSSEHQFMTFRRCAWRFLSNIELCFVFSIRILIILPVFYSTWSNNVNMV